MVQIKTFSKRSSNFRQLADSMRKTVLSKMVEKAVLVSPVDTAAYVDSFGFNNPEGFSSKDRPRQRPGPSTDVASAKARNIARLQAEVESLSMTGPVVFGNGAPHANIVENGTSRQSGYQVFAQVRREFSTIARQALQEVKQG